MDNVLNIYKCSGIDGVGKISEVGLYKLWTAGTKDYDNSLAMNNLIVDANYYMVQIETGLGDTIDLLNKLDLTVIALQALTYAKSDNVDLARAGRIIATMKKEGFFESDSTDDDVRAENLDSLDNLFKEYYYNESDYEISNEFTDWWKNEIIDKNYSPISEEQKEKCAEVFQKISGGVSSSGFDIQQYTVDAGQYFLYTYLDQPGKYSKNINNKRNLENKTLDWAHNGYPTIGREQYSKLAEAGIMAQTGMYPKDILNDLKEKGNPKIYSANGQKIGRVVKGKVGDAAAIISAVAKIIEVIVTLVMAIVSVVMEAKYKTPPDSNGVGSPSEEDYGVSTTTTTTADSNVIDKTVDSVKTFVKDNKILVLGGLAILAVLFFKKK